MRFSASDQHRIVARANLAPSVHNTQPARWRFDEDGAISILADQGRFLTVGDPSGRDAALSCGAALEGTLIELARHGLAASHVDDLWLTRPAEGRFRPVARIELRSQNADLLHDPAIEDRFTWRGGFAPVADPVKRRLAKWAATRTDITLVTEPDDLEILAVLNDQASLRFYRQDAYRDELLHWMRLTRRHPDYATDGLNLEALHLSALEGHAARLALGHRRLFHVLDRFGVSGAMLGERSRTMSATAVVLFHRPQDESPVDTGRHFYRMWLELAKIGLAAWPMAVLADDPDTARECATRFGIGEGDRLINVLRVGGAARKVARARREPTDLIVA